MCKFLVSSLIAIAASTSLAQSLKPQPQFGSVTPSVEAWSKKIVTQIVSQQEYPRSAQVRRAEGTVKVRVTVAADGSIASTEVVESSAFDVLNREAVRTIERSAPFPAPPGGTRVFVVPLVWKLGN
jgi:protein TonB